jgi:lipoate-protein ligase B
VTYHGIALNVSTDLLDFELIDACGTPGLVSTSIAAELGRTAEPPTTASVARAAGPFRDALAAQLGVRVSGADPGRADPAAERAALERLLVAA